MMGSNNTTYKFDKDVWFSNKIVRETTGSSGSNKMVQNYHEAFKNSKDYSFLDRDRHVLFESEHSSIRKNSRYIKITPAILPASDSTLVFGYVVEAKIGESRHCRPLVNEPYGYDSVLSKKDQLQSIGVTDSRKKALIPMELNGKNPVHDGNKMLLKNNFNSQTPYTNVNSKTSEQVVYASIGGTIEKGNLKKVIPCRQIRGSVYVGSVGLKTKTLNSTLKLYFDRDLHMTTNDVLKDKRVRRILIELCT